MVKIQVLLDIYFNVTPSVWSAFLGLFLIKNSH